MKLVLKTNNSIHTCEACIHQPYCEQDENTLLNEGRKYGYWTKQGWIPIPDNCPILVKNSKEKVIFT